MIDLDGVPVVDSEYPSDPRTKEDTMNPTTQRAPGRPALPLPDPIPDTPENVAKAILTTPPKDPKAWKFLKLKEKKSA